MVAISQGEKLFQPKVVFPNRQNFSPDDLNSHACIGHRMPSGKLYRWEFERHGEVLTIDVSGGVTLDNISLMAEAAADGLGVAYVPQVAAQPYLDQERLRTVLDNWLPAIPGLFLYHPGHRRPPPALRALIDVIKDLDI